MTQSLTDRAPSPNPPYPIQAASAQQHQGKILPSYTYGHPVDHVPQQQQQFPPSMFDARYQKEEQTLPNQASNVYNQVSSEMYGFDQQQYLKQPDFSTMLRDSISPVQMSLSPPQANEDTQMSTLRPPSQQGGIGGITPTRSNFTLIAPTPRVPSLMAKAVEALDADVASPESMMTSSPDGGHSEEEAESKADVKLVEKPTGEIRQLRRGRSGGQLSLSSLAQQQQQSSTQLQQQRQRTMIQTNHRSAHEALPAMQQQPAIVLPSKIKALGTLPADEAFSASLDQLEDVPHGTKPPYLWWTLIRAAILGAPEQKLQMETLTHLIQQKYP